MHGYLAGSMSQNGLPVLTRGLGLAGDHVIYFVVGATEPGHLREEEHTQNAAAATVRSS